MIQLDAKIPEGPIEDKWHNHLEHAKLVGPRNRPTYDVIVVGTGLAGASAASSLAAQGYNVHVFIYHDTPRRAHSIAAQGGINACKNYREDGDSTYRLFYDTQKGGDFRSREANVYRLAQTSTSIIDQCVAQGVPFAREYGGMLANRSFGGVLVERTFYCRGQTGQQLLLGAYQALQKEIEQGKVTMHTRSEMLDLVMVDGRARGIVYRDMVDGSIKSIAGEAVVLATGGYGAVYFNSTNAINSNGTAIWRAHKRGAAFANPSFVQIHPTCIPVSGDHQSKLTLMSESLRNDGRVWVPRAPGDKRKPGDIPESERYYYLEERYPTFGNLVPRDVASRAAKVVCDDGLGVGSTGYSVYMDFRDAIANKGQSTIAEKYGNLFDMYTEITGESPYEQPFRIYPAVHYCMGGLWVDYNLQTTIPGLYAIGEANFSDHGANRLGASSLMQCLADGYFILPQTIGDGLQPLYRDKVDTSHPAFAQTEGEVKDRIKRIMSIKGDSTPLSIHKRLGKVIWNNCGMSRNEQDLNSALDQVDQLKQEFWNNLNIPGSDQDVNQTLERAMRLMDFLEIGELMCRDALVRDESCGCHFRDEHVSEDGEVVRNDDEFSHVAAWEWKGEESTSDRHQEQLVYEAMQPATRSYK
ncbi:MAG: succinate dehydrogenase flavoprotein subunit [Planctomycetes bacterium TMED75]|nr:succinate dehydrogenase flavoprotein subunit [Planctomycetaceae bacterium]OUU96056.1 MAG: succinate dehydrogenase flavoprotein subunit [Planctomycetes bacterium TMED75]